MACKMLTFMDLFLFFRGQYFHFSGEFYFGSTNPRKTRLSAGERSSAQCGLSAGKRLVRASAHAGPILPFFYFSGDSTSIFPGIVLPFFRGQYFHFVIFPQYGKSRKNPFCFYPTQVTSINFYLTSNLMFDSDFELFEVWILIGNVTQTNLQLF